MQTDLVAAPPSVVLFPKNRGLAAMAQRGLQLYADRACEPTYVRGEDIPFLANEVARTGRSVLAFTGEDLLEEWLAAGSTLDTRVVRGSVAWDDAAARYGKPALCLIGPRGTPLPQEGTLRVALCSKYTNLAQRFLRTLERPGLRIEPVPISGTVEAAILHDVADFMIDVVVSGITIDALGLDVRSVILTSDLAVLEANR